MYTRAYIDTTLYKHGCASMHFYMVNMERAKQINTDSAAHSVVMNTMLNHINARLIKPLQSTHKHNASHSNAEQHIWATLRECIGEPQQNRATRFNATLLKHNM